MCCCLRRRDCSSMPRDRVARALWPPSRPPGRCCRAVWRWWCRRRCGSLASCSVSSPATSSPLTPPSGVRRGLSLRHDGPAVLLVDEASRVRDELWATISPMLAAAPAAQQILLSTPAGASGEFHRAWSSNEDWQRVQITADQCSRISAEHLAAERIRLGDALYRQEYFGAFVSAPGSVFDAEVLAHMFGDDAEDEPNEPAVIVQERLVDRFLQ